MEKAKYQNPTMRFFEAFDEWRKLSQVGDGGGLEADEIEDLKAAEQNMFEARDALKGE